MVLKAIVNRKQPFDGFNGESGRRSRVERVGS